MGELEYWILEVPFSLLYHSVIPLLHYSITPFLLRVLVSSWPKYYIQHYNNFLSLQERYRMCTGKKFS
jgi:hypothetical protein